MSLLPFFEWIYSSSIGETIRNSTVLFPVLEAIHLLGLAFAAGAILLVDFRLMGLGIVDQPAATLSANTRPVLLGALAVLAATGIPLFMSESIKAYYSFAFWVKMTCLLLAIVFALTIRDRVIHAKPGEAAVMPARYAGIVSLVLWFGVAWGGRWIGFS